MMNLFILTNAFLQYSEQPETPEDGTLKGCILLQILQILDFFYPAPKISKDDSGNRKIFVLFVGNFTPV